MNEKKFRYRYTALAPDRRLCESNTLTKITSRLIKERNENPPLAGFNGTKVIVVDNITGLCVFSLVM